MSAFDRVFDRIERGMNWCCDNPKKFWCGVVVLLALVAWWFSTLTPDQQKGAILGFLIGMLIGGSGSRMGRR